MVIGSLSRSVFHCARSSNIRQHPDVRFAQHEEACATFLSIPKSRGSSFRPGHHPRSPPSGLTPSPLYAGISWDLTAARFDDLLPIRLYES